MHLVFLYLLISSRATLPRLVLLFTLYIAYRCFYCYNNNNNNNKELSNMESGVGEITGRVG